MGSTYLKKYRFWDVTETDCFLSLFFEKFPKSLHFVSKLEVVSRAVKNFIFISKYLKSGCFLVAVFITSLIPSSSEDAKKLKSFASGISPSMITILLNECQEMYSISSFLEIATHFLPEIQSSTFCIGRDEKLPSQNLDSPKHLKSSNGMNSSLYSNSKVTMSAELIAPIKVSNEQKIFSENISNKKILLFWSMHQKS